MLNGNRCILMCTYTHCRTEPDAGRPRMAKFPALFTLARPSEDGCSIAATAHADWPQGPCSPRHNIIVVTRVAACSEGKFETNSQSVSGQVSSGTGGANCGAARLHCRSAQFRIR